MRLRVAVALLAGGAVLLSGLAVVRNRTPDDGRGDAPVSYRIAFSHCDGTTPEGALIAADLTAEAARHPGVEILYADAGSSGVMQVAHLENFLARKVDALLVLPKDATLLAAEVARFRDAGIPVVSIGNDIPNGQQECFVGSDDLAAGREAGRYAVRVLNGKGRIVELCGTADSLATRERSRGFGDALRGTQIERVARLQVRGGLPAARALAARLLGSQSPPDLICAHGDALARGAYLAARDTGRTGKVRILAVAASPGDDGACRDAREGRLTAAFVCSLPAAAGLRQALRILGGENVPSRVLLPISTVERSQAARDTPRPPSP